MRQFKIFGKNIFSFLNLLVIGLGKMIMFYSVNYNNIFPNILFAFIC